MINLTRRPIPQKASRAIGAALSANRVFPCGCVSIGHSMRYELNFRVVLCVSATLLIGFQFSVRGERTSDATPTTSPSISLAEVRNALRPGNYVADIIDMVPTPRQQELTKRFQAALAIDPAWFPDYVKKNSKPGEPLPYNTRFGISKAEYDEFIKLASSVGMGVVGHFDLEIVAAGNDAIQFKCPATYVALNAIAINFSSGELVTRYGKIARPQPLAATMRTFGQWAWQQWVHDTADSDPSATDVVTVRCSVGKMGSSAEFVGNLFRKFAAVR